MNYIYLYTKLLFSFLPLFLINIVYGQSNTLYSFTYTNNAYIGIGNPFKISLSDNNLLIKTNNGEIIRNDNKESDYIIIPQKVGQAKVFIIDTSISLIPIDTLIIKVLKFPEPTVAANFYSEVTGKGSLKYITALNAFNTNLPFDITYEVKSFRLILFKSGKVELMYEQEGFKLSKDVVKMLQNTDSGDWVLFDNIIVSDQNGNTYTLNPIKYPADVGLQPASL